MAQHHESDGGEGAIQVAVAIVPDRALDGHPLVRILEQLAQT